MPPHNLICIEHCMRPFIMIFERCNTLIKRVLVFHCRESLHIASCMTAAISTQLLLCIRDFASASEAQRLARIFNHRAALPAYRIPSPRDYVPAQGAGGWKDKINQRLLELHSFPPAEVRATYSACAPRNCRSSDSPMLHLRPEPQAVWHA